MSGFTGGSIVLTAEEERIFRVLRETAREGGGKTVLRVAGGWVRDKLLGVESNDIDIATDNCMGEEFAQAVKAYITSTSVTTSDECGSSNEYTTGSIGVISANPEQSKHLETATMKVYGQEIDFVNLRSEEYSDSTSRIPTVQFGTPEQDAYRRDFTVNSLFYNIMTESVEDYTQMGLSDMSEGVIRTPLPAVTTFHDDPLRLLRAVRFATRYNFLLDHDIQTVGQMPEIHEALQCKISKERVYKELCGCFTGKLARPLAAIELIHEMKFFHVIFAPPSSEVLVKLHATVNTDTTVPLTCDTRGSEGKGDTKTVSSVMETWERRSLLTLRAVNLLLQMDLLSHEMSLFAPWSSDKVASGDAPAFTNDTKDISAEMSKMHIDANDSMVSTSELLEPLGKGCDGIKNNALDQLDERCSISGLLWASCVSGVRDIRVLTEKKKSTPLPLAMLSDCFKLGTQLLKVADLVLSHAVNFDVLASALHCNQHGGVALDVEDFMEDIGLTVRSCKHTWRASLLMACAMELAIQWGTDEAIDQSFRALSAPVVLKDNNGRLTMTAKTISKYRSLYCEILKLKLDSVWTSITPIFHGKALLNELKIRPGPAVGTLMDFQFRWQVRNPRGDKAACLNALLNKLSELEKK